MDYSDRRKDSIIVPPSEDSKQQSRHRFSSSVFRKRNYWLPISVVFVLVVMGGFILVSMFSLQSTKDIRSRASLSGPTLSLVPARIAGSVGKTLSVGLTLDTNSDAISAAYVHLTYDPAALEIYEFSPTSLLPVVLRPVSIIDGNVTITLGVTPTAPFRGAGILGSFTVKILKNGTYPIQFSQDSIVTVLGRSSNALTSSMGTTITSSLIRAMADYSGNGKIDIIDYTLFMNYWYAKNIEKADLNGDGKISVIDYTLFMNEWNIPQ